MGVKLTDKAVAEVKRLMSDNQVPEGTWLRVGIVNGGCSGFEYSLIFDESADAEKDHMEHQDGVPVVVAKQDLQYLEGTIVDYHDSLMKKGFVFQNPLATRTCGCGSSFSVPGTEVPPGVRSCGG